MRESQLSSSAVPARGTGTDHLGRKGPSSSMTKLKRNAEIAPDPHVFWVRYLSNVKILGWHFEGWNSLNIDFEQLIINLSFRM